MNKIPRQRRKHWLHIVLALVVIILGVFGYGFAETYMVETKEYTFAHQDVPTAFDGVRIAFVSDIHRSPFFSQERVRHLVERVNSLEPDLILLGGDYVYLDTDYAASCFAELENLRAPLGCYAILGNHDYGKYTEGHHGPLETIEAINAAGITLLRDKAVWVERAGTRIRIGGVSDYEVDRPSVVEILQGTGPHDLVILAAHEPDYAEELPEGAVDLMLAGHTHGGQVTFFGLWAPYVPSAYGQKYRTGLVKTGSTSVIVSNGIGTSTIPPIRLFARPQIVIVTLKHTPLGPKA